MERQNGAIRSITFTYCPSSMCVCATSGWTPADRSSCLKFDPSICYRLSGWSTNFRVSAWEPTMWWTSDGERVLRDAEWALVREGLSCLWDEVEAAEEEDGPGSTGIAVFDELPKCERLALLASAAKGLTDENEPCPQLTALTEGTVAAIFAHVRYHIEVEIELQEDALDSGSSGRVRSRPLRDMVLAAVDQVGIDRGPLHAESGGEALA